MLVFIYESKIKTFLHNFRTDGDSNRNYIGAPKWQSSNFKGVTRKVALMHRVDATNGVYYHKMKTMSTYCQIVDRLFKTYAIDDVKFKAAADIINFKQSGSTYVVCYSKNSAYRC